MKRTRRTWLIGLALTALLGVLWTVGAQERPPWAPPVVLPPEPSAAKSVPPVNVPPVTIAPPPKPAEKRVLRFPQQKQNGAKQEKADPTLIIPPEAFENPRPALPPVEMKPEVVQAGGKLPPPSFPPTAPAIPAVEPAKDPLPLPVNIEPKQPVAPVIPPPLPEPTKALIVDLPPKSTLPKDTALPLPSLVPPPEAAPAPKKIEAPAPALLVPPPEKDRAAPAPVIGVTMETPPANGRFAPPPVTGVVSEAPPTPKVKSFVPIRPTGGLPTPPPLSERSGSPAPLAPQPLPTRAEATSGALSSFQTPSLIVEKRGPSSLRAGETQLYQIVIRNQGTTAAQQIRVEDDIPAVVRVLAADPAPQVQNGRAAWILTALPPGGETTLRLTLKADADVPMAGNTSVHVSAGAVTRFAAAAAPTGLVVRVSAPDGVRVGKPAVFDVHVSNPNNQPLTGIVLYAQLPDGLTTPVGDKIEGEVNEAIGPGEFKVLKMPTSAVKPGRHTVQVKVATSQGEASATASVEVAADSLQIDQASPTRLTLSRDGDLRITVTNHTGKPLRNVTIANLLPEGLAFMGASDRGLYQSNARTVHWLIDNLAAGATKTVVARVNAGKAGQFQSLVSVMGDGVAETRSAGTVVVEGLADLSLAIVNRDNPLEVGRETIYEIQVQNPGSAVAGNVRVQVQFPPGIVPRNAQADTRFSIDGQTVTFEPIASIAPQGQTILRVQAVAQTPGPDQRVRASVVSDAVRTPLQREASVLVYSGK